MKKINRDGIRALIVETLEEISLGEAKKKSEDTDETPDVHKPEDTGQREALPAEADPYADVDVDPAVLKTAKGVQLLVKNAFDLLSKNTSKGVLENAIAQLKNAAKSLESHIPEPQPVAAPQAAPVQETKRIK